MLDLDSTTNDRLALVAATLGCSRSEAVTHLLNRHAALAAETGDGLVPIFARYRGRRVEATYDPATHAVVVTTAPLAGAHFDRPSPAAEAVIGALNPKIKPARDGWLFWKLQGTGKELRSIR